MEDPPVGITASKADVEVEPELLAPDVAPHDGKLAMKLTDLVPMPTSWAGEGLFAVSTGTPVQESFAGRPSFTYVHSGFAADAGTTAGPVSPTNSVKKQLPTVVTTMEVDKQLLGLASDSGIAVEYLREMYEVLQGTQPQLILAGPPGTGKTWLAKRLAVVGSPAGADSYDLVQFHPSYAYEDFIEGPRPKASVGSAESRRPLNPLLDLLRAVP